MSLVLFILKKNKNKNNIFIVFKQKYNKYEKQ